LEYHGAKYEDIRVSPENWPALKPKMPMGQMPVLEVDGKMLCQSTAIARYLAREFGLTGKNNLDMATADMLVDGIFDMWGSLRAVYMPLMQGDSQAVKEQWDKYKVEHLAPFLERYQKFYSANKSGWMVGDEITWADIVITDYLSVLQDCFSADALQGYADLKKYVDKVQNVPQLKTYIANRPETVF
jgi:glutathione S-transferase